MLAAAGVPDRTVFHCFTGGPDGGAAAASTLGAHLSFSGIVTFKTAADAARRGRRCPLDRLLVETDAPYLAPVPIRGKRNEPARRRPHRSAPWPRSRAGRRSRLAAATWATANRFYGAGRSDAQQPVTHAQSRSSCSTTPASPSAGRWARTTWPTPTPCAASPAWPASGPGDRVVEIGAGRRLAHPGPGRDRRPGASRWRSTGHVVPVLRGVVGGLDVRWSRPTPSTFGLGRTAGLTRRRRRHLVDGGQPALQHRRRRCCSTCSPRVPR